MNDTTWHWFKDLESRAMWFADARGIPKPIASEAYDRLADALVERIGKGIIAAPLSKAAWTAQFLGLCKEADRKRQRATQWYSHCEIIAGRSVEPEEVGYPISEEVSDPYESARKLLLTAARRFAASETQLRRLEAFFETRRVACRESAAAEGVSPEANRESVEKARSRAVAGTLLLLAEDYCREHAQLLFREGFQIERPLSASVVKAFDHLTHTPSRYNLDLSGLKPGFEALWADAERYLFCGLSSRNDADLRALPMSFLVMLTITRLYGKEAEDLWIRTLRRARAEGVLGNPYCRRQILTLGAYAGCDGPHTDFLRNADHLDVDPHFQFDVLHPDLPAAFSVFIHRG